MSENKLDEFVKKVVGRLEEVAIDLVNLDVVTLSTNDPVKPVDPTGKKSWDVAPPEELTLIGRTRIQLDGDIYTVVPLKDGASINEELWKVHQTMVAEALKQRAQLVESIAGLIKSIAKP